MKEQIQNGNTPEKKQLELRSFSERDLLERTRDSAITREIEKMLSEKHINLRTPSYWKHKNYTDFLTKQICSLDPDAPIPFVTCDYYIEKIMLPDNGIYHSEKSDYDMGNNKAAPQDMSVQHLIEEIWNSLIFALDPEEDGKNTEKGIYEKLFAKLSKGGLKEQFESVSNISLSSFDDVYSEYKLLKLLFKFSKTKYYGKKINFYLMFRKASTYNLNTSNTQIVYKTNGYYIALLENELLKEVPLNLATHYYYSLKDMNQRWDQIVRNAQDLLFEHNYMKLKEFDMYLSELVKKKLPANPYKKSFHDNINSNKNKSGNGGQPTLFSTVYFWALLQQYRCVREEMLQINKYVETHQNHYRTFIVNPDLYIIADEIPDFLLKARNEIAEKISTESFSKSQALELIENSPGKIRIFIELMSNGTYKCINGVYAIPLSFIMSALFAIRDAIINDEKTEYSYYLAPKSGKMNLIDRITRETKESGFYKLLWLKRVDAIHMQILHVGVEKYKLNIENSIYTIMSYLFTIYDYDDFEKENTKWLGYANQFFSDVPMK